MKNLPDSRTPSQKAFSLTPHAPIRRPNMIVPPRGGEQGDETIRSRFPRHQWEVSMTIRMRGLLILMGSLVAGAGVYWFIFHVLADAHGPVRVATYPLALPLVGILIGTLELATGVPIRRLDEGW